MPRLTLTTCTLRPFRRGDEASIARHANNRKVWLGLRDIFPHPYTERHAAEWVGRNLRAERWLNAAIDVGGAAVGGIGLTPQSDVMRHSAEIGYWLGEAYWGRGIATEAVVATSDRAFAELGLMRLYAHVFAPNVASMRVLEKAGFTREGCLRQAVLKDGALLDMFVYGRLRP